MSFFDIVSAPIFDDYSNIEILTKLLMLNSQARGFFEQKIEETKTKIYMKSWNCLGTKTILIWGKGLSHKILNSNKHLTDFSYTTKSEKTRIDITNTNIEKQLTNLLRNFYDPDCIEDTKINLLKSEWCA